MQNKSILIDIIQAAYKWRRPYLISLVITAILVSIIMLLKPDMYRANTIFYPASTSIQKPVSTEAEQNINYYGDDHDVDRMLSIATSHDLKFEIIDELDLGGHYQLKESEKAGVKIFEKFNKYYQVEKTEYDAINISFDDPNPGFAADVANLAAKMVSERREEAVKKIQRNAVKNAQQSVSAIEKQLDELNNKITDARKEYGIYDTDSQAEGFAILESRGINKKDLDNRIKLYTEGVSEVRALEDQIQYASEMLVKNRSNLYRMQSAVDTEMTSIHIVQRAYSPMKKHHPQRSLYVLGSILFMALLGLILILLIENARHYMWTLTDA